MIDPLRDRRDVGIRRRGQLAGAGAGTPSGTVTPLDGNGQAAFTVALDAGDHRPTVSYDGDADF